MIELRCVSPGHWESTDGRVLISLDPTFETECDEPHPVKFSRAERDEFASMTAEQRARLQRRDGDRYWALLEGKKGCYCHGGEVHYYSQWTARVDGTWTESVYDTFGEARQDVEKTVGRMRLSRRASAPAPAAPVDPEVADEIRALDENIARMTATLQTEDGPFVDRQLLASNRRRLTELTAA